MSREMASAQQLHTAFTLYADDNDGAVLPGYPTASMVRDFGVTDDLGEPITGPEGQRHPWRLAPYLDYDFRGLYGDESLLNAIRDDRTSYRYVVSLYPSLGMNIEFVGGSVFNGLGFSPQVRRMFGNFYITRLEDPARPSHLMSFTSAHAPTTTSEYQLPEGHYRLQPPSLTRRNWDEAYDPTTEDPGNNAGFVSLRWDGKAVSLMLDGHAESLGFTELDDMTRWCDLATEKDWTLSVR